MTFLQDFCNMDIACSEGKSFNGNGWLDKAQTEMSVSYPAFLIFMNNVSGFAGRLSLLLGWKGEMMR